MPVVVETPNNTYTVTPVTVYNFTFSVFQDSDLVVYYTPVGGTRATLVLNVHYTVTINPATRQGSIDIAALGVVTGTLLIARNMALTQATEFNPYGPLPTDSLNDTIDRAVLLLQQMSEVLDRAIRAEIGSGVNGEVAVAAGRAIGWNAMGTGLTSYPVTPVLNPNFDSIQNYASLAAAIAAIGANRTTLIVDTPVAITGNTAVPENISLTMIQPGSFAISLGVTLTINGRFFGCPRCFSGAGAPVFGLYSTSHVDAGWWDLVGDWAGSIMKAMACRTASGYGSYILPLEQKAVRHRNVAANYVIPNYQVQVYYVDTSAGAVMITLPDATQATFEMPWEAIEIVKVSADANPVILFPAGAQTINGNGIESISTQWAGMRLTTDNNNWIMVRDAVTLFGYPPILPTVPAMAAASVVVTNASGYIPGLPFRRKVISIGDWDMDTTASVNIAHGLTLAKIIGVTAIVFDDAGAAAYPLTAGYTVPPATDAEGSVLRVTALDVVLTRRAGGVFDAAGFATTPLNRGTIIVDYVD